MKSSLLRPSRICGIWWAMAENGLPACDKCVFMADPVPGDRTAQPAESESCVFLSAKAVGHRQKTGICGVPGSHLAISPSGLSLCVALSSLEVWGLCQL